MSTTPGTGAPIMAKQQRSVALPAEVYPLCDAFEAVRGIKFNRLVLASLLHHLFDGWDDPTGLERPVAPGMWTQVAVLVERGELKIDDIPMALIDGSIAATQRLLGAKIAGGDTGPEEIEELRIRLRDYEQVKHMWEAMIEDYGPRGAIVESFGGSMLGIPRVTSQPDATESDAPPPDSEST